MSKARKEKRAKERTSFSDSVFYQLYTFDQYLDLFTEIAISSFEWTGLPSTVDARFIEVGLYENDAMLYFNDDVMGNLCLKCVLGGQLDVYNIPLDRRAYASMAISNYAVGVTVLLYGIICLTGVVKVIWKYMLKDSQNLTLVLISTVRLKEPLF